MDKSSFRLLSKKEYLPFIRVVMTARYYVFSQFLY